jgi:hypothetical protein
MMAPRSARGLAAALALALSTPPAAAQTPRIERAGRAEPETDTLLARWMERPPAVLLVRDTTLVVGDTLTGPVWVLGATVRMDGVIRGDLLAVDANVFLRPNARVTGAILNLGGGVYPTESAVVDGAFDDRPFARYTVERRPGVVRVIGTRRRSIVEGEGLRGLRVPTYDRVDGIGLGVGVRAYLPLAGTVEPVLRARGGYATRREAWTGAAELGLYGVRNSLVVTVERTTATRDAWIRGDLRNSAAVLFNGSDFRDYHRADRVRARLARRAAAGRGELRLGVGAEIEDATSLSGGDPWALFAPDAARPNPAVDDGRIAGAVLDAELRWPGALTLTRIAGTVEVGREALGADFAFARYEAVVAFAMAALADHTIEIDARVQGPLPGSDPLPRQRWGILGGGGTLETRAIGEFRGDRLALVRTTYGIPFRDDRIALIGNRAVELIHAVGMAWTAEAGRPAFRQALGLRFRLPVAHAHVFVDPDGLRGWTFGADIALRPRYAWEHPYAEPGRH